MVQGEGSGGELCDIVVEGACRFCFSIMKVERELFWLLAEGLNRGGTRRAIFRGSVVPCKLCNRC